MKTKLAQLLKAPFCAVLLSAVYVFAQEPITATWIGPASGGEWNTPEYWDTGAPPLDATTNAFIGAATNVNYNLPMIASSFGMLSNNGVLNVNTNGFNCSSIVMIRPGGGPRVFINPGGEVNVSGNLSICSNSAILLAAGGLLNVSGELQVGSGTNPPSFTGGGTAGAFGFLTNSGGTITAASTHVNRANSSATSLMVINGGTNDLGAVTIRRSGPSGVSAPGAEGLAIYSGLVRMTALDVGGPNGNSWLTMYLVNGTVTNTGPFVVRQVTANRGSRFLQTGGVFVGTDTGGVNLRGHSANNSIVIYSVTGGTNLVEGFVFGYDGDMAGTARLTNAAKIYVGASGFTTNLAATLSAITIALNSGGVFGAQADWTSQVPMILAGGVFDCANLDGTPHDITLAGVLSGSGALRKTGAGKLTLEAANSYTGDTIIYDGTLALGAYGSIATSPQIIIGPGTAFDVSAVEGGFVHSAGRTLGGFGTVVGDVTVASGAIINPGSNVVAGTLTFAGSLTQTGGAINHFDLSTDPFGAANDLVVIGGDLNVSGTNVIEVIGGGSAGAVHKLFAYGGSFNGTVDNFDLVGVTGVLSNNPVLKEIYLVVTSALRSPTNVTWVGNAMANRWDTLGLTNWVYNGALDYFVPGDHARFDDLGAANSAVEIVENVMPSWVTLEAASDYTFAGAGAIAGQGGLTKTNIGRLTIQTTNSYTGPTIIGGGVVEVGLLADGGLSSSIGAASPSSENLVLCGGTLRYTGPSVGIDRGATLSGAGGTIDVAADTTLTMSGELVGTGVLGKAGPGTLTLTGNNTYSGGTVVSEGILRLNTIYSGGTNTITLAGGTLFLGAPSDNNFPNPIHVASDSSLVMGGSNNRIDGAVSGSATLNVTVNSGLVLTFNGNLTNFTGVFNLGTSEGTFRFNSGGGNTTFGCPNATIDLGISAILQARNAGTMAVGALRGEAGTRVLGQGSGSGTLVWEIGSATNNPNSTFHGTIADAASTRIAALRKVGSGTFTLTGGNTYSGATTVQEGVLALADYGGIDYSSLIRIVAPGILCVTGRYDGTLYVGASTYQTLTGDGTVRGKLDVNWGGTLSPGLTIGTLTVTEDATFVSGGTALMEIDRATPQKNDKLVAKSITFGGTLVVTNVGTLLYPGDTFDLFDGALSGAFGTIVLPNYYEWDTSRLAIDGTIRVVKSLLPPLRVSRDGSTLTLSATNGIPFGPLTLLTTTNVALPLTEWSVLETNAFDWEGNYSVTTSVDPGEPERFYLLLPY